MENCNFGDHAFMQKDSPSKIPRREETNTVNQLQWTFLHKSLNNETIKPTTNKNFINLNQPLHFIRVKNYNSNLSFPGKLGPKNSILITNNLNNIYI